MPHQRYTLEIDEPTLKLVWFPSTTKSGIVPITIATKKNPQHIGLLANYQSLDDTIGLDWPLATLIQFGRLDLNSPPITLLHTIPQSPIPITWVFLWPNDLNKHGTNQVATSPSSSRNWVVTQTAQPTVNPMIVHSPVQHAVNTFGTNLLIELSLMPTRDLKWPLSWHWFHQGPCVVKPYILCGHARCTGGVLMEPVWIP